MINYLGNKIINTLIIIFLGAQCLIFFLNQKPLTKNFSQKNITVENFSSIVLGSSGMTKIGSEKLNKINDENIYLEGKSYLENADYKIYGYNIYIDLENDISESDKNVKVINSMGELKAKGFKNLDYERKIYFEGEVTFIIHE